MRGELRTRRIAAADAGFLLDVFSATRAGELAAIALPVPQLRALLRVQFELQQRHYLSRYPEADHRIIEIDGVAAGQLRVARRASEMVLIDLALLPIFQRQGHGTRLLVELIEDAARARVPLRLSVRAESPARRLYERLGFREQGGTQTDIVMVLPAPAERPGGRPLAPGA